MIYVPKKKPKKATLTTVFSLVIAIVLYVAGELVGVYKMLFGLPALILISLGIMVLSRYILCDHKYVLTGIDSRGAESGFSIIKVSGNREVSLAHFDVISIYALEHRMGAKAFEEKHGKVDKIYNYCSNLRPTDICSLAIEFNGKKVLFLIETDDNFFNAIKKEIAGIEI
jgi:hypothetical protein